MLFVCLPTSTAEASLCLDSFLCMHVFSVWLYIACMRSIVTWWGGPGGIEAYPEDYYYFLQCFDTVGWVIWPSKTRPRNDIVFNGTLNPTLSINQSIKRWYVTLVLKMKVYSDVRSRVCWRSATRIFLRTIRRTCRSESAVMHQPVNNHCH